MSSPADYVIPPRAFSRVPCLWCSEVIMVRNIQWHFLNACAKCPRPQGGERICSRCQRPLRLDEFPDHSKKPLGKDYTCLSCHRRLANEWRQRTSESLKIPAEAKVRPNAKVMHPCKYCSADFSAREVWAHRAQCPQNPKNIKRMSAPRVRIIEGDARDRAAFKARLKRRKLTEQELDAMIAAQDGLCAICGCPPSGDDRVLFIDHCHATDVTRGLLCRTCNCGLGQFKDSPALLDAAKAYLLRHHPELLQQSHTV